MRERKKVLDKEDSVFYKEFSRKIFRIFRSELKSSIKRKTKKYKKMALNN